MKRIVPMILVIALISCFSLEIPVFAEELTDTISVAACDETAEELTEETAAEAENDGLTEALITVTDDSFLPDPETEMTSEPENVIEIPEQEPSEKNEAQGEPETAQEEETGEQEPAIYEDPDIEEDSAGADRTASVGENTEYEERDPDSVISEDADETDEADHISGETDPEPELLTLTADDKSSDTSGTCGTDLTWKLEDDGKLVINGTGDMADYASSGSPWFLYAESIISVRLPAGMTGIGRNAFEGCADLTDVYYDGTETAGEELVIAAGNEYLINEQY